MLNKISNHKEAIVVLVVGILAFVGAATMQAVILWQAVIFSAVALVYFSLNIKLLSQFISNHRLVSQEIAIENIQTIDKLSYETNLVALQAAMNAAEAESNQDANGIVKEVRQLALRTADAAKNTCDLIHSKVTKADKPSVHINSKKVIELTSLFEQSKESLSSISTSIEEHQSPNITEINQVVTRIEEIINEGIAA